MTLKEFAETWRARADLLQDRALKDRLGVVAANEVSAMVKRRVFLDGIAIDGTQIGQYSTRPAYFSTDQPGLPKISPKGKTKRAKKTRYSETGYAGFRRLVGRQNSHVDLHLTGATFRGCGVGVNASNFPAFGIKTKEATERIDGNEKRFGKIILTPNAIEREAGRSAALRELQYILNIR